MFWQFSSTTIEFSKSLGNSWGNSYLHLLLIIIYSRFTCGEGKLCCNMKSPNIFFMIVFQLCNRMSLKKNKKYSIVAHWAEFSSSLERWKQHLRDKITKKFYYKDGVIRCSIAFFFYEYKFTVENKKTKKDIHQASRHLRMPGSNLKTIKFKNI